MLGGHPLLLVDATVGAPPPGWSPGSMPVVVVGVVAGSADDVAAVDPSPYDVLLAADDPMLPAIVEQATRCPVAAVSLAVLLRGGDSRTVDDGLAAESAVYSTLQAGAEFARVAGVARRPGAAARPRAAGAHGAGRRRAAHRAQPARAATTQ